MTLYQETLCVHGGSEPHQYDVHDDGSMHLLDKDCAGGSREEVTIDRLVFMVANACASHDMQSGPFDMLAEIGDDMAGVYRKFARKHVDAALEGAD